MSCLWKADCDGRARPDSTEICHDTAECSWILGVSVPHFSCTSCDQNFRPIAPYILDFVESCWNSQSIQREWNKNRSDIVECHAMHFPRLHKVGIMQRNMWKWLPDKGDLMLLRWERRCRVWQLGEFYLISSQNRKGTNHRGLWERGRKWMKWCCEV